MITHLFNYYDRKFSYTWKVELPYRVNKDDQIYYELLDRGELLNNKQLTDEWYKLVVKRDFFEIDYIQINHIGNIDVWLKFPQ